MAEFLRRKAAEAEDEEERRKIERALRKVLYGTNRIWLYGVPLRVSYRLDTNALVIRYSPEQEEELRRAYEALRGRLGGCVTAGRRHVALKVPEALRELARRAAQGDQEAERFLRELRRYAEAHDEARGLAEGGLLKKLEEVLKPHAAVEGLVVDVGDAEAVVKVRAEVGVGTGAGFAPAADCRGPECKLRVTVEYAISGVVKAWRVTFSWQRTSKGVYTPQAAAKGYDAVEARILAKVFDDDRFLKQDKVTLTARHLEALLRFKEAAEAVERWLKTRPRG
ncbi:PaRep2b protein [Pyrobaculum oguniense TE7]|uniref:PaRep2b protein n=1 Tax=Pyrobaculum oguniense (strain DSM 13380 / JCM 10595 / TE7) TaxID=698757 RepID=H6QAQ4_PYROT|nr:PaRep2b protein [Pyrobaculum oguniense TE7]